MERYIKIDNTIVKTKYIVLVEADADELTLAIHTTNDTIYFDVNSIDDLHKFLDYIHNITNSSFISISNGYILNPNYISTAEIIEKNENILLSVFFNNHVQNSFIPSSFIIGDTNSNNKKLIIEGMLTCIGESDYESFIALY